MSPKRNKMTRKEKEDPIAGAAMEGCVFPEEIMLCILTRLPVKSIVSFESVCKPWLKLFHTPEFVKMYQGEFSSDPKKHSVIFYQDQINGLYVSNIIESAGKTTKTIHDCPYPETHSLDIVGCCNGLICLSDGDPDEIVLWNPALKLYKFVPASKLDFGVPDMVSLGFGYDGDDFKVAMIANVSDSKMGTDFTWAEVYSANSDSWTTIELGFRFGVSGNTSDLSVNGNLYWVGSVKDDYEEDEEEEEEEEDEDEDEDEENEDKVEVLMCFDVRKMVFKIVPLPAFYRDRRRSVELVDWKGNVGALLCEKDGSGMGTSLGVWVLDDSVGIWKKNHTLGPIQGSVDRFTVCLKNGKLVGKRPDEKRSTKVTKVYRWNRLNGSKAFRNSKKFIVFDPDNGCVEEIVIEEAETGPFKIYGYTESMIQVKGMTKAEKRESDE